MSVENTHFGAERIARLLENCKSIYFIGIGGINMSSLAHVTHARGYLTAGSDRTRTSLTEKLESVGIRVNYTHDESSAEGFDAFVYTVAISEDNPEYAYAKRVGKPCISRADYLGYIMTGYPRRVGVAGMHGKSTCTSMCAHTMISAGADPTVLSGAVLASMDGAYRLGDGDAFVFEACEYMDSFLDFNPNIAVILNIEMDHVDYFKSMKQIRESFAKYASLTGPDGYAVCNADDAEVTAALASYTGNRLTFGIDNCADLRAVNITLDGGRPSFDVIYRGESLCRVSLGVSGRYNVYNALAAMGACLLCGLSADAIASGLESFCGAGRRMELKGKVNGADVYDDYGHHPTEIRCTLSGARALAGDGRLFCVYQPHTYSRTAALMDGFAAAFEDCDRVALVDVYAAREKNEYGVSSELLAKRIGERATYAESFSAAAELLEAELRAGDVAVIMGAGDVYKVFSYLTFDQ